MPASAVRLARLLAVAALVVGSAGCARLLGTYDIAPNGLATRDERLRSLLAGGQAATAFEAFGTKSQPAPDDEVLRALYQGVLAYYAGSYRESAQVLDIAAALADDRITKSISRSALSVVSNDLILPYEPGRTERLMIPFYAALARLRLGDGEGAAVEARRLSLLLQRYQDDEAAIDRRLAASLRYFAGAIFEARNELNDADIAYRNAFALDSTLAVPKLYDRAPGTGSVVVVLEQGFVAHKVEQGLHVLLAPQEIDLIANGDGEEKAAALGFVAARTLAHAVHGPSYHDGRYRPTHLFVPAPDDLSSLPRRKPKVVCRPVAAAEQKSDSGAAVPVSNGSSRRGEQECREEHEEIDELPYLLKVAWPVYLHDMRSISGARLIAGRDTLPFGRAADVSRGVLGDFEEERGLIIARTVARGAAKLALTKGAEEKIEEKSEVAGQIIGLLGNISSVLLERADTRSWHLLPAGLAIARVELPPGEHSLRAEVGHSSVPRTVDLPVAVSAGRVSIVAGRAW